MTQTENRKMARSNHHAIYVFSGRSPGFNDRKSRLKRLDNTVAFIFIYLFILQGASLVRQIKVLI